MYPHQARYDSLERMFRDMLDALSVELPRQHRKDIEDYLQANEFGLAFNGRVCVIREFSLSLSPDDVKLIDCMGKEMNMDPTAWQDLQSLARS